MIIKELKSFKYEYTHIYPNVMIKDGKEYFIINRVVPFESKERKENYERIIDVLKKSNGIFTIFYGVYTNPFDMLQDICQEKHKIRGKSKDIFTFNEDGSIDFKGDRDIYTSMFMYKIYDQKLVEDLKEIVKLINNKEWDKAVIEIVERKEKYKEVLDKTKGLDYYRFYELIDKQVELVADNTNYEIFKADVEILKNANEGSGLASITANNWLKKICNLSEFELTEYVSNYKEKQLDPYNEQQEELEQ